MILYLPVRFDHNEWFVVASIVLLGVVLWMLPRRFTFIEWFFPYLFNFCLALSVDTILAAKPFDLYDVGDTTEFELVDFLVYWTLYPLTAHLMLYLYDKLQWRGWQTAGHILLWASITWGLEWAASEFSLFKYKGWSLWYSAPVYVAVYALNIAVFHFVRNELRKGRSPAES
ncbi:hypothetical protein [Paenibacillus ehimensis]|uniref:hypothetical protein n=1 Tax=Paenibacillus ehimensis TaxID=79264 RepID=UPI00046ECF92|nr:hypothetical protein [Paenibacillus ehimensis]